MARTTTIPVTGTREYVLAFKAYAFSRGEKMSDLVREALEAKYGEGIEQAASFFASSGHKVIHEDNLMDDTDGPGAA